MLEAEGRSLRRSVFSLSWTLVLAACAGVFLLVGGGLLLLGFYRYFLVTQDLVFASLLTGVIALAFALLLVWTANRLNR